MMRVVSRWNQWRKCHSYNWVRQFLPTNFKLVNTVLIVGAFGDREDFAALVLLDLSAAFDKVDHDILLQRLQTSFGIGGAALKWSQSYLTSRTQYVRRGTTRSTIVQLICGVPQGSVFIMYTADLVPLIQLHCLSPHLYADDTQIYGASGPSDFGALPQKITAMSDSCCRLDVGQSAPTVFR